MDYLYRFSLSTQESIAILFIASIILLALALIQRTRANNAKKKEKQFFKISSELTDDSLIVFSKNYQVQFANNAIKKYIYAKEGDSLKTMKAPPMFKIRDELLSISSLLDKYTDKAFNNTIFITDAILKNETQDMPVNLRLNSFSNKRGKKPTHIGMSIFDISNKLKLSKIHYQNISTKLPNQNRAIADIGLMVNKMHSSNKKFAVIIMNIDNFSELIGLFGYQQFLYAISSIAKYFQKISEELDLSLYHMTGNHFLILIPDIQTEKDALSLIEKFKSDSMRLLYTNNTNIYFTISSGVSIYPNSQIQDLLNDAYRALAKAVSQGSGHSVVFHPEAINTDKESPIEYKDLRAALENKQLTMYYQPIRETDTKSIIGAEALMRWIHPTKGFISPDIFIPIAEKTGFINELGKFATTSVIEQLGKWNKLGFKKIQVAINLSLRELENTDQHEYISNLLEKHKVRASQIKIEVTENTAMHNQKNSHIQFTKLKAHGIEISLDDFGTGHSSFSLLMSFPINTVKIDKSFILDIAFNKDHQVIVKAMIAMVHALGMKVIAEGIEDIKAVELLEKYKCDYIQGYYYGKPMPVFEFQELIRTSRQERNNNQILEIN